MIVEYIRYQIPAEESEAFEAAYARAAVPLSRAPQCVDYELSRCVDEPESYILRIVWTSAADHTSGFRGSANFTEFLAEIQPVHPGDPGDAPLRPDARCTAPGHRCRACTSGPAARRPSSG